MADQPAKTTKRVVKNPETFRERAIKAAETTDKPGIFSRLKTLIRKLLSPIFGPLKRAWLKLFSIQPFKSIAKLAYWIGLIIFPVYLRNSWKELKLVSWPSLKQSRQLTFAVLVFAIIFGSAVATLDYGLDKLFKHILLK